MPVTKVTAWKISTGQCFENKTEACHEEMTYLIRTRGETNAMRIVDESALQQAVEMQAELVAGLREMRDGLNEKKDASVIAELDMLLARADGWLTDANELKTVMEQDSA